MRKRIGTCLLAAACAVALAVPAMAESYKGDAGWNVTFNKNKEMVENFEDGKVDDLLRGMQPGDDATITLVTKYTYPGKTDWYMANDVIDSLENSVKTASGGGYTYKLTYKGPGGSKTLFDSDTVGGDYKTDGGGLHEATGALKDYFFMDTLASGESGTVTLYVALDGETQGNDYQDTLAELKMNFAVELPQEGGGNNDNNSPRPGRKTIIKTGDEFMPIPYMVAIGAAGVVCLLLGIFGVRSRRKERARVRIDNRKGGGSV